MTKLEKAREGVRQAQAHYATYLRATREARARLAATPKGKAFLVLRRSARRAKYSLLAARDKRARAALEEKDGEAVHFWTRFKAKDSPFHPDYNS